MWTPDITSVAVIVVWMLLNANVPSFLSLHGRKKAKDFKCMMNETFWVALPCDSLSLNGFVLSFGNRRSQIEVRFNRCMMLLRRDTRGAYHLFGGGVTHQTQLTSHSHLGTIHHESDCYHRFDMCFARKACIGAKLDRNTILYRIGRRLSTLTLVRSLRFFDSTESLVSSV